MTATGSRPATPGSSPGPVGREGDRAAGRRDVLAAHAPVTALAAALGAATMWLVHTGLIDDSYITLAFAQNVADDLHWGLVPDLSSNAATSPLNVAVLALATAATGLVGELRPVVGLGVVTVLGTALMGWWASRTATSLGVSRSWAAAVVVVVLANPFLNSSVGLEVVPESALMVGLLAQAVRGRAVAFGVVAGLAVLTRLDLGVVVAVVYLLSARVRGVRAPLVAVAVALPWFAVSWWFLGSAIPSTFALKTLQSFGGDITFVNGLWTLWAPRSGTSVLLAVVPALLGVLVAAVLVGRGLVRRAARGDLPVAGLGLGGVAYFAAYWQLDVPPYQWYYVPSTVALSVAGVLGLGLAARALRPTGSRVVALVGAVAVVAAFVVSLGGRALPWAYPPFFGNWATAAEYVEAGREVGEIVGDATVLAPPEIGTLAYACDCTMVDRFSDPGRTLPLIEERIDRAGPVGSALLRANFAHLDRSVEPAEPEYELVWTQEPVPAGAVSWPTGSPATGPATLVLRPLG